MNIYGLTLTAFFSCLVLFSPKKLSILGLFSAIIFITEGQSIDIVGFNLTSIRFVLLSGVIRIIIKKEYHVLFDDKLDKYIIIYCFITTLFSYLRTGTTSSVIYRLGVSYDLIISYFLLRALLTDRNQFLQILSIFKWFLLFYTLLLFIEVFMNQSVFHNFGGIGEQAFRDGTIRAQGSFRSAITAGTFGATLFPLFFSFISNNKKTFFIGTISSLSIVYFSNSSGPLLALIAGCAGLSLWPMRHNMKIVCFLTILFLILLDIFMKAPIWYIFSKLGALTGGHGWHRSYLIDSAIRHFSDWFLIGTNDTSEWMPYTLKSGGADITNQYIASAINGGILGLLLYLFITFHCFKRIGESVTNKAHEHSLLLWCVGSSLFSHAIAVLSVTYFDQLSVYFWGFIAILVNITKNTEILNSKHNQ